MQIPSEESAREHLKSLGIYNQRDIEYAWKVVYYEQSQEWMKKCEQEQFVLPNVLRRELLLAAICEYNSFNTQTDIKAVDDWLEKWDSK